MTSSQRRQVALIVSKQMRQARQASDKVDLEKKTSLTNSPPQSGASTGIGNALARLLAKNEYSVALAARSEDKLKVLRDELNEEQPIAEIFPLDVQDQKQVDQVVTAVVAHFGQIDVLINNAGLALGSPKPFQKHSILELQTVIQTNVLGPMYLTHAVLNQSMLRRGPDGCGEGDIVNISSITGLDPPPMGEASYHASKTALEGFTNALRQELSGSNIRVLTVRPGFVGGSAQFHAVRHSKIGADPRDAEDDKKKTFEGMEPLLPDDVARVVLSQLSLPKRISLRAVDVVPTRMFMGRGCAQPAADSLPDPPNPRSTKVNVRA